MSSISHIARSIIPIQNMIFPIVASAGSVTGIACTSSRPITMRIIAAINRP